MITFVLGTRPEIIKLSPLIALAQQRRLPFRLIHTGQHYTESLDKVFFDELRLPQPHVNLGVGSGSHGKQTALMLEKLEAEFMREKPSVVIVQGDTNSVLAGALAAAKLQIPVAHVEAGLRSFDRRMPEELNRIVTDHLSTYLLAPTENAQELLQREGIPEEKITVSGNTVVDAVLRNKALAAFSGVLSTLNVPSKGYCILTLHRPENVDDKETLAGIFEGLRLASEHIGKPVLWPVHPRTKARLEQFQLTLPPGVRLLDPQPYLAFLHLMSNAFLILTDSGGIQEEACVLGVPCVTLRTSTERPETLDVGSNVLAGVEPESIVRGVKTMLAKPTSWENPFGDGKASERILDLILAGI